MPKNTTTTAFDDMPEEFSADDVEETPSVEDLLNNSFNDEQDEAERAKLNPPTGDWEKEDTWEFVVKVDSSDNASGDCNKAGRTFISFSGKPKPRMHNDFEYQPMLFFRISPDKRLKEGSTEIDFAYKLYLKAKDAYIAIQEEKPRKLKDLVEFLKESNKIAFRTMNGDNGPIVLDIKQKRVKK